MRRVYMDYSATSPVDPRVLEAMLPYFSEKFGNPSSVYSLGFEAKRSIEESREKVARLIEVPKEGIVFTSCGTESNNLAIKGVAYKNREKGKHIITSSMEHPAVLNACEGLKGEGFEISYVPADTEGIVKVEELEKAIRKDTILISIMYANHEIGTIQPIKEIGRIANERGIAFHVDAVAAAGKIPMHVTEEGVDLLSLASQDLYGPKGAGALYISKDVKIKPLLQGGRQERSLRPGTENVPAVVGFGRAAEICRREMENESARLKKFRDKLAEGLLSRIKESYLNGHPTKRIPNNAHMRFSYIEGESIVLNLDSKGISVATGSACTSGTLEPSHVLLAIGLSHEQAHGSLQFTLGRWNSEEDVDYVIDVLPDIVRKLREMSPLTPKGFA